MSLRSLRCKLPCWTDIVSIPTTFKGWLLTTEPRSSSKMNYQSVLKAGRALDQPLSLTWGGSEELELCSLADSRVGSYSAVLLLWFLLKISLIMSVILEYVWGFALAVLQPMQTQCQSWMQMASNTIRITLKNGCLFVIFAGHGQQCN